MADELTTDHLVSDLNMELARLEGIVEEVSRHVAEGNPDSAALVLGTQDGKIGRFMNSYNELYMKLGGREAGERAMQAARD